MAIEGSSIESPVNPHRKAPGVKPPARFGCGQASPQVARDENLDEAVEDRGSGSGGGEDSNLSRIQMQLNKLLVEDGAIAHPVAHRNSVPYGEAGTETTAGDQDRK